MRWSDRIARMTPKDKLLHFTAGVVICSGSSVLISANPILLVLIAGVGKEIYDLYTTGRTSVADIVATLAGGLSVYIAL